MRKFLTVEDSVVPMLHPRILVMIARERGASLDAVLGGTDIPPASLESPEARINYLQFGLLISNARTLTGDPFLGGELGRRIHLQNLGMLGVLMMNSTTVGDALRAAVAHHRSLAPVMDLQLEVDGEVARLSCQPSLPLGAYHRFAVEMMLGIFDNGARALLGDDFTAERICLDYPKPATFDRYAAFHTRSFEFDAPAIELSWDAAALSHPIAAGDPIMAELARRECDAQLAPFMRGLLGEMRRVLHARPGQYPGVAELAAQLQTSERSLRRHLAEMDTSYQSLLDEARRRHAEQALRATAQTQTEIAERLGYGDVRSFRRAWVRWTGVTPAAYRAALDDDAD